MQNQIHVSSNQSSQVPCIIFFQFMKLSFSYKDRFFHKLPPAHCQQLKTTFLLFNRNFLYDEKVFQTALPIRVIQKWDTELEHEQNSGKPFNQIYVQLLACSFNKHFQSILDTEADKLRESWSRNNILNHFPFGMDSTVFGLELVIYTDTGFFLRRHRQACFSNALTTQGKQATNFWQFCWL